MLRRDVLRARVTSALVGTSVIWESEATHFVDDLAVELEPR